MLNSALQSDYSQEASTPISQRLGKQAYGKSKTNAAAKPRSRRSGSVTVPASPVAEVVAQTVTAAGQDGSAAMTVEQLQAEVQRCQAKLKEAEREGSLRAGLIRKLCEDLRDPISNINMAVRMLGQAKSESEQIRYGSILRTECARQLEILNNVNRMQVVMGTYGKSSNN